MRAGQVIRMRVSPIDSMHVVDILDAAGSFTPGMSFASAVSRALGIACRTLVESGAIPDRDGFEYSQMMARFPSTGSRSNMLKIAKDISTKPEQPRVIQSRPVGMSAEAHRMQTRIDELKFKEMASPDSFTARDKEELVDLMCKLSDLS